MFNGWIGLAELPDVSLFDIQQCQPGLIDTLVKAFDLVTHTLAKPHDNVLVAHPIEARYFHRVSIELEGFLAKIGGVINFDDRVSVPGGYFHQGQVLAVRRDAHVADHFAQGPVFKRVGFIGRKNRQINGQADNPNQEPGKDVCRTHRVSLI